VTGSVVELELSPRGGRPVSSNALWAWPGCSAVVRAESLQWLERPVSGLPQFVIMEQLLNARSGRWGR
jgi:hypothetical protein